MNDRPKKPEPPRIWQRMLSGRRLNLATPSVLDIEIIDIARGLSRINRWSGQTKGKYGLSVAQHSVMVTKQTVFLHPKISAQQELAVLLHDAPEYVIGDLISPFKHSIGGDYLKIEASLQNAINTRFALVNPLDKQTMRWIKQADQNIAWLEATQLAGFSLSEASRFIARKPNRLYSDTIQADPPEQAEKQFLKLFHSIQTRRLII